MKRANGTGTIVKKQGRRKPFIVYGGAYNDNGKRVIPFLGSFERLKDAQECLDTYNTNPQMIRCKMTFEQIYEEFKKGKRYEKLSKSQKDCYSSAYKRCAEFKRIPFSQLRTEQFNHVITRMEKENLSLSSMQKVKILLSVLSDYAISTDSAVKNYAQYIVLPAAEANEKRSLTDIEFEKIKKAADEGNEKAQWAQYLIYSGWRISEMLELTRFNYDEVEKAFRGGKKTANSKNRLVPVHPTVQYIVNKQLAKNGDTVFCMDSGKPMSTDYFRKKIWKQLKEELNLDNTLTPHECRHTFATLLKKHGADEFYRKRLIGHSCGDVTNDIYTEADIESLRKTILLVEKPKKTESENIKDMKNA